MFLKYFIYVIGFLHYPTIETWKEAKPVEQQVTIYKIHKLIEHKNTNQWLVTWTPGKHVVYIGMSHMGVTRAVNWPAYHNWLLNKITAS